MMWLGRQPSQFACILNTQRTMTPEHWSTGQYAYSQCHFTLSFSNEKQQNDCVENYWIMKQKNSDSTIERSIMKQNNATNKQTEEEYSRAYLTRGTKE